MRPIPPTDALTLVLAALTILLCVVALCLGPVGCGGFTLPQDRCQTPRQERASAECHRAAYHQHSGLCDLESLETAAQCWPECADERPRLDCLVACEREFCACRETASDLEIGSRCESRQNACEVAC